MRLTIRACAITVLRKQNLYCQNRHNINETNSAYTLSHWRECNVCHYVKYKVDFKNYFSKVIVAALRSEEKSLLLLTRCGDQAFSCYALRLWHTLPEQLQDLPSLSSLYKTFKKSLLNYLCIFTCMSDVQCI